MKKLMKQNDLNDKRERVRKALEERNQIKYQNQAKTILNQALAKATVIQSSVLLGEKLKNKHLYKSSPSISEAVHKSVTPRSTDLAIQKELKSFIANPDYQTENKRISLTQIIQNAQQRSVRRNDFQQNLLSHRSTLLSSASTKDLAKYKNTRPDFVSLNMPQS